MGGYESNCVPVIGWALSNVCPALFPHTQNDHARQSVVQTRPNQSHSQMGIISSTTKDPIVRDFAAMHWKMPKNHSDLRQQTPLQRDWCKRAPKVQDLGLQNSPHICACVCVCVCVCKCHWEVGEVVQEISWPMFCNCDFYSNPKGDRKVDGLENIGNI